MATYTLLQLVQNVLSSIDGDEITSINDTPESTQVIRVLKTVYFDIVNRAELPEHCEMITLDETGDTAQPIIMTLPSNVAQVKWVKYDYANATDADLQMTLIQYLQLEDFMDMMHNLDESATNVSTMSYTTSTSDVVEVMYLTDKIPSYWTSWDDQTILFDSIDTSIDTDGWLYTEKSLAYVRLDPTWTESDSFVPDLDAPQFSLLINEAKALAWAELRQAQHAKAEQGARRDWVRLERTKYRAKQPIYFDRLPDYGRK